MLHIQHEQNRRLGIQYSHPKTLTHQTCAPHYSLTDTKCQTTAEHALAAGLALFVSSATVAPVLG